MFVNDYPNRVLSALALPPAVYDDDTTGAAVDLVAGDGSGFAVLAVGDLVSGTTATARVEESADGSSGWATLATFAAVTAGSAAYAIRFDRTKRYVRAVVVVAGAGASAALSVVVGQPRKTM